MMDVTLAYADNNGTAGRPYKKNVQPLQLPYDTYFSITCGSSCTTYSDVLSTNIVISIKLLCRHTGLTWIHSKYLKQKDVIHQLILLLFWLLWLLWLLLLCYCEWFDDRHWALSVVICFMESIFEYRWNLYFYKYSIPFCQCVVCGCLFCVVSFCVVFFFCLS